MFFVDVRNLRDGRQNSPFTVPSTQQHFNAESLVSIDHLLSKRLSNED